MTDSITIRKPDDWHLHLRDGDYLRAVLPDTAKRFARAIVMPNLKPPVTTVALAQSYRQRIVGAMPAGVRFEPLMTLYLTDNTRPEEIIQLKQIVTVKAVKYYPAGATTNSDAGVTNLARCAAVLEAMQEAGVPLLTHRLGLRQDQQIIIAFLIMRHGVKTRATKFSLLQFKILDLRSHRTVKHQNPLAGGLA